MTEQPAYYENGVGLYPRPYRLPPPPDETAGDVPPRFQTLYLPRCSCGRTAPKKLCCGQCGGAIPQVTGGKEGKA